MTLTTALVGIWLISAALQGYLSLVGRLGDGAAGLALRTALAVGGFLLAMPGGGETGLSHTALIAAGLALSAPAVLYAATAGRRKAA